jgi:hypothetical protein
LLGLLLSAASLAPALPARAELTEEQRKIPLEADSPDPALSKIVLLAGSTSNKAGQHEYFAGCALLAEWLRQTPGVWPVLVADGWPKNEEVLKNAKAVVVYADGGPKLPFLEESKWNLIKELVKAGTGLVMLHQAVDVPEERAEEIRSWIGGVWKKDIGCRGHWDMEFDGFAKHPVLGGVSAFAAPVTLGVGLGLLLGKVVGVFGMTMLAVRIGIADAPAHACDRIDDEADLLRARDSARGRVAGGGNLHVPVSHRGGPVRHRASRPGYRRGSFCGSPPPQ